MRAMQPPPQYPPGPPQYQLPQQGYPGPAPGVQAQMAPGPATSTGVNPMDAVKFLFDDPDWKTSLLFAVIFMFIPIVGGIAVAGWYCEIHQRLARRHPRPIPKLDFGDFGAYIGRGLKPFVVQLAVGFPVGIVLFICYVLTALLGGMVASAAGEPFLMFGFLGVFALFAVGVGIAANVVVNAAVTRAELTEDFGKALDFGKIMAYGKATWVTVIVKNIIFGFIAFGMMLAGMLACGVGLYVVIPILGVAALHLRWQIYADYLAKGGEQIELAPPQQLQSEMGLSGPGMPPVHQGRPPGY